MPNKVNKNNYEGAEFEKKNEAFETLKNWVKSVPETVKDLEEKGDQEKLIKYKKQVKLVLQKLEQIKDTLDNEKVFSS